MNLLGALTFLWVSFHSFFLKLIVTCRLCVIYVSEDNNSNVRVTIIRLLWITWTSMSDFREKPSKLNYPLPHSARSRPVSLTFLFSLPFRHIHLRLTSHSDVLIGNAGLMEQEARDLCSAAEVEVVQLVLGCHIRGTGVCRVASDTL